MPPTAPHLVSIVIPVHNREKLVADTIASCLAQTHTTVEIIAVDDCSTDGSFAALEAIAQRDPRVRPFRLTVNMGQCVARNVGASHAQGAWLWFLDSDDLLVPRAVETLLGQLVERNLRMGVVMEKGFWDPELEGIRQNIARLPAPPSAAVADEPLWDCWRKRFFSFNAVLMERGLHEAAGGFQPAIRAGEEANFIYKLLLKHPALRVLPWPEPMLLKRYDYNSLACQTRQGKTPWGLIALTQAAETYLAAPVAGPPEVRRFVFDELYRTATYAWRNGQKGRALIALSLWESAGQPRPRLQPGYHDALHRLLGFCAAESVLTGLRKIRHPLAKKK